jgi:hypothetical protein
LKIFGKILWNSNLFLFSFIYFTISNIPILCYFYPLKAEIVIDQCRWKLSLIVSEKFCPKWVGKIAWFMLMKSCSPCIKLVKDFLGQWSLVSFLSHTITQVAILFSNIALVHRLPWKLLLGQLHVIYVLGFLCQNPTTSRTLKIIVVGAIILYPPLCKICIGDVWNVQTSNYQILGQNGRLDTCFECETYISIFKLHFLIFFLWVSFFGWILEGCNFSELAAIFFVYGMLIGLPERSLSTLLNRASELMFLLFIYISKCKFLNVLTLSTRKYETISTRSFWMSTK